MRLGVNFINIICVLFSYESLFGSFFSSFMYLVKAAEMMFVRNIRTYNVDEIDGRMLVGASLNNLFGFCLFV
jgi:hypothetical protein